MINDRHFVHIFYFENHTNVSSVRLRKVSIITFATYVLSGDDHVLTVEKAFVCLTLFDIIKMPLAMLPLVIVYMAEVNTKQSILFH